MKPSPDGLYTGGRSVINQWSTTSFEARLALAPHARDACG
jgi:hypothetical protein